MTSLQSIGGPGFPYSSPIFLRFILFSFLLFLLPLVALTSSVSIPLKSVTAANHTEGFKMLPGSVTGIEFVNQLAESRFLTNQVYLNGSGVAAGDVNGDGLCDLYFAGLDSNNALYINLGDMKFQEIATSAGVDCAGFDCTGVVLVDIDNDLDLDILVNTIGGGTLCFINDGKGQFTPLKPFEPEQHKAGSMSMALADVDGDGDLDLYVTNYRPNTLRDQPGTRFNVRQVDGKLEIAFVDGKPVSLPEYQGRFEYGEGGRVIEHGEPDFFYLNDGNGNFPLVPWEEGRFKDSNGKPLPEPRDWGLSVLFRDLNHDGAPDLYVCNDFDSEDRIWMNDGHGNFRALPSLALRQTSLFSMGIDASDINADGWDDFMVLDMLSRDHTMRQVQTSEVHSPTTSVGLNTERLQYSRNMVYLNRGDQTFAEIGRLTGLHATEWSWTVAFLDVDLDGYEDVMITNGHERDAQNVDIARMIDVMRARGNWGRPQILAARKAFPRLDTPNLAFRNSGQLNFQDKSSEWGFDQAGISHGMVLADLDGDGDLDVVINNLNAPATVLLNQATRPRLAVELRDPTARSLHVGARVRVDTGPVIQSKVSTIGGRYLSSDPIQYCFATNDDTSPVQITVTWRDGTMNTFSGLKPGMLHILTPDINLSEAKRKSDSPPIQWFEETPGEFDGSHQEWPFDDFARQPALFRKYSQDGPGVAVYDIDLDGTQEILVGSGKGGKPGVFKYQMDRFIPVTDPPFHETTIRDQMGIVVGRSAEDQVHIFVAEDHYEDAQSTGFAIKEYNPKAGSTNSDIPASAMSAGPLAKADVNGNGNLELFIGGRAVPGKIPMAADSYMFRRTNEGWVKDEENSKVFQGLGMVRGAVFSDYDQDGDPDLFVAREWNSIVLFKNEMSSFRDVSEESGLKAQTGWWSGIATGDFNNDGFPDLVVGNWGNNMSHESDKKNPYRFYYIHDDHRASVQSWPAYFDNKSRQWKPWAERSAMDAIFPFLRQAFPTQIRYGNADVDQIVGEALPRLRFLEAATMETTVFINHDGLFKKQPLPDEAQFSPVFGLNIADFNGDGYHDIFLTQNFFAINPVSARFDAGLGLILQGNGAGDFRVVPNHESGIRLHGEGRGSAVLDFNKDGRLDLVVAQNGVGLKVFENKLARNGLRVHLKGSTQNPDAIGAALKAGDASAWGPLTEVQAGSGYLSMDSPVKVLTFHGKPTRLWLRWPGDKTATEFSIPQSATSITLTYPEK